jgi:hypothetical protein
MFNFNPNARTKCRAFSELIRPSKLNPNAIDSTRMRISDIINSPEQAAKAISEAAKTGIQFAVEHVCVKTVRE